MQDTIFWIAFNYVANHRYLMEGLSTNANVEKLQLEILGNIYTQSRYGSMVNQKEMDDRHIEGWAEDARKKGTKYTAHDCC